MTIRELKEQRNELDKKITEVFIDFGKKVEKETGFNFIHFVALEEEVGEFQYCYNFELSNESVIEINVFYVEDEVEPSMDSVEECLEWNKEYFDRDFTEQEISEVERIYEVFKELR